MDTITNIFSSFKLEDKTILEGGGDVMKAKSMPPSAMPVTNPNVYEGEPSEDSIVTYSILKSLNSKASVDRGLYSGTITK